MEFLDLFSLKDVAIVFTGLMVASIIRIYYDSHVNRKKAERFGSSLGIYNTLLNTQKEGLIIIAGDKLIFSNDEAAEVLQIKSHQLDIEYLKTLQIQYDYNQDKEYFMDCIKTINYTPDANILSTSDRLPVSLSINKFTPYSNVDVTWYVIILQDMTNIRDLQEGAESLLEV
jgi:hypothetical protein